MDKRMVYIGLILLLIALVVFIANNSVSTSIVAGFQNLSTTQTPTVQRYSFSPITMPVAGAAATFYIVLANFSAPVNVYLFNSSAYGSWRTALTGNTPADGLATAKKFEGNGTFYIFRNTTLVSIPSTLATTNRSIVYSTTQNATYAAGTYYFVIDNTNGSTSSNSIVKTYVKYLPPVTNATIHSGAFQSLNGEFQTALYLGVAFFFTLVAGIVILVLGVLRKSRSAEEAKPPHGVSKLKSDEVSPEYVNRLYRNVGRSRPKRLRGKTVRKISRKTARKRRKH